MLTTLTRRSIDAVMPKTTVRSVVDRYIRERRQRHEFSADTVSTVRSTLHRFAVAVGSDTAISALNRRHIRTWWSTVEGGPSTTRNNLSIVRTFIRWSVEEGLVRSDLTRGLSAPREPNRLPRTITVEAANDLVQVAPDARARLMILWMLHIGLRCGEMTRVQIGDIDWTQRLLIVRGKGQSQRLLPIPAEAWSAMNAYLAEHPAASGPLVRRYDRSHQPLSPHYVSDLLSKWLSDAGVKATPRDGMSGHALRRTCASDLLDGGAHIRQVQQVLGHRQLATTEKYLRRLDAVGLRAVLDGRSYMVHDG